MKISRKWSAKEGDVHASSVSVGLVLVYIALHTYGNQGTLA